MDVNGESLEHEAPQAGTGSGVSDGQPDVEMGNPADQSELTLPFMFD